MSRPVGNRNTRTLFLQELGKRVGCDPAKNLMDMATNDEDPGRRLEANKALMPYMYPKLANMEVKLDAEIHQELGIEPEAIEVIAKIISSQKK